MTDRPAGGSPPTAVAAVVLLTLAGAWLRAADLDATGLWLDEILGVRFVGPEHGPAYYLAIRLGHWLGGSEVAFRAPFAIAGILTLPLVALAAGRFAGPAGAVAATALLAFSPLHIYYSREARPYALLVLWGVVGLWAAIRLATGERRWPWHGVFAAALGLLLLTSSNGVFYGVALLAAYLVAAVGGVTHGERLARVAAVFGGVFLGGAVFAWLYGGMLAGPASGRWLPAWPLLGSLVDALVGAHSEQGVEVATWMAPAALALALLGVVVVGRRHRLAALGVSATAVVGFLAPVLALESRGHWINARYVLPALAPLVVFAAAGLGGGVDLVAKLVARVPPALKPRRDGSSSRTVLKPRRVGPPSRAVLTPGRDEPAQRALLAVGLAVGVAVGVWGVQREAIARSLTGRADWRHIAAIVAERAQPGDLVVATNDWTAICLGYYLPKAGPAVRLENVHESVSAAAALVGRASLAWVVSGGHHVLGDIRQWASPLPLVWSHPVEAVRVWFHPDRVTYLTRRLPEAEVARLTSRFWDEARGRLTFGEDADAWLVDGWHAAERDPRATPFRWVEGRRARLVVPVTRRPPSRMTITLQPFSPVQADQRATFTLNGVAVGTFEMTPGWQDLSMDLPASAWHDGLNLLQVDLAAAVSPFSLGMGDDARALGVAVQSIAFER